MSPVDSIASLLPSATEICFALGLGPRVVGVSHECDHPPAALRRPALTRTRVDPSGDSAHIDRQVREILGDGLSIYQVDEDRLAELAPDLVVTQDTCEVCAVSLDDVQRSVARLLGKDAQVLSLSPNTLEDVFGDIERVAEAAGVPARGADLVADLRGRLDALRARLSGADRPRVLALEWLAPPMVGGHWTPELLRMAGGEPILGHDGGPTRAIDWSTIAGCEADALLVIPCGFPVEQSRRELDALLRRPEIAALPAVRNARVAVIDGNAYFNRPGPRLVDSAELASVVLHPERTAGHVPVPEGAIYRQEKAT